MESANLQLSPEEMRLVAEPGWILTKNSIIRKTVGLFAALSEDYKGLLQSPVFPKISKGENYQGLPYVMLDYPRLFGREDVLAVRTFFWWGHAFSVTLHLKGEYLARYRPLLGRHRAVLAEAGFHVGVSDDEWRHEHVPENYRPIVSADDLERGPFLKLSAACGLDRWEEAQTVLGGFFRVLAGVLEEG
ncbi:hypothetical protein ACQ86N_01635 [Puia sp. P3]|uniref:hypothetical protein n=1 Tax=Puia sp. P3 TaxID=3423952 RepID=UPI003D676027